MARTRKPVPAESASISRPVNDAFGPASPHYNLPFPTGNLTAAEIVAYCPHWLKSVDVIDRFVTNGGKAKILVAMVNKYRDLPNQRDMQANSLCVMMQVAMRSAGFEHWVMQDHYVVNDARRTEWHYDNLDVTGFRTPRFTHPKGGSRKNENVDAAPVEFRSLAINVKEHPSGDDTLDLTRCVTYAVAHPNESWLFPVDFKLLVNKLGGPQLKTHLHLDTQAFKRRVDLSPGSATRNLTVVPLVKTDRSLESIDEEDNMVTTRRATGHLPATPTKRGYDEIDQADSPSTTVGGKRRSGRIVQVGTKDLREPDSDAGTPYKNGDDDGHVAKKRKRKIASSEESDFVGDSTSDSDDIPDPKEDSSDHSFTPEVKSKRPVRGAALKGRQLTKKVIKKETVKMAKPTKGADTAFVALAPTPEIQVDPELMKLARSWEQAAPPFVKPPVLDSNRLVIDADSIFLYAAEGCTTREQMWATALSSTRFNGPRRSAPFRELYRLSDPMPWDACDWAENIRWAKEQHKAYGVTTWTEYDYHLEQITQWRHDNMWVSEETITVGGLLLGL